MKQTGRSMLMVSLGRFFLCALKTNEVSSVCEVAGEEILFFFGGLSGVGGGVVGLVMIGAGSMMAAFYVRSRVMVDLIVSGRVCDGGGGVSFSTQGVGRRTVVGR